MLIDALRTIVIFLMKMMSKYFSYILYTQTSTRIIIYTNNILTKIKAHNQYETH